MLIGRVMAVRQVGKIQFIDVMRDHTVTQLTTANNITVRRGDFIQADGIECKTRDGLLGVKSDILDVIVPFKGVHFPDHKMGQISDCERHVDLLANNSSNTVFRQRAKLIQKLRQYLVDKNYLEVETPILSRNANGATARPFTTTSINDDDDKLLYLRISPELYLKRLIIGGFDRVFEIGKVFRNEGIDATHNPEFTSLELYQSFANFGDLKSLVCELFAVVSDDLAIKQHLDIMTILQDNQIQIDFNSEVRSQLEHFTKQHGLFDTKSSDAKLFDRLVGKFVEPLCQSPTILTGFPLFTSPLAAASTDNPNIADRLEVFVDGKEIANGYQELTDADEQQARFQKQLDDRNHHNDEETPLPDADYVSALRLGMPPTIGLGIGIDRLVMFLTKQKSIKNVIFFPL